MKATEINMLSVARQYTLLQPIGQGAMGTVYDAVEPSTGHHVAVKVLNPELAAGSDACARFVAEALALIAVDHPGSTPVYGMGTLDDGRPFFVMKKIRGRTLRELLLERGGRTSDLTQRRRLLSVFERICETIAFAHSQGIVHRDLKPENVLLDDNGAVIVIDWGLAKRVFAEPGIVIANPTISGTVMGSPGYMSPEQASGESDQAGPPSDVFALGVILYEILTGRQPFAARELRQSILRAIHRVPEDPRRLALLVTRSQAAICRKALEKDPQRRYQNSASLLSDLNALRNGNPLSVGRRSLFERMSAWYRREPFRFALGLSTVVALLVGGVIIGSQFWLDHRLANEAFRRVTQIDGDLDALRSEVAQLRSDRAKATAADVPAIDDEIKHLSTQLVMKHMEAFYLTRSVIQLRFIRAETGALEMRRERLFATVRAAIDYGEPEFARSLADLVLERYERDAWEDASETDLDRIRALRLEAESAL